MHTTKPEAVGQIMCAQVHVASADRSVAELMPIFSEDGRHHIPIIDADNRLVGIITQSDFVRALYDRAGCGAPLEPLVSLYSSTECVWRH